MTTEQLNLIEYYASLFMTLSDIALLMDLEEDAFREEIQEKITPAAKAYYKGKLTTVVKLRESVLKFAEKGSPQAEQLAHTYLQNQKRSEL